MSADEPKHHTLEDFTDLGTSRFELVADELENFVLEHLETRAVGGDSDAREPFSILFLGPPEPILAQSIYRLRHPELGSLDLFLVPVGPNRDNTGIQYEAVFS